MADKPNLLVLGENVLTHVERLARFFTVFDVTGQADPLGWLEEVGPAIDGLAISGGAEPRGDSLLFDKLPNLSIVAAIGVGYSMVDSVEVLKRGILMTHGPGSNTDAVADLGLGLMLAVSRRIIYFDDYTRRGLWAKTASKGGYTSTPTGKTMGILGLGAIGSAVARRASGFDMAILYHQRTRRNDVPYRYYQSLGEMAEASDYLMVCIPATDETRHVVNADVLSALGPDGYLINVSRGLVVDEDALEAALASGAIAGAGLDVFQNEPNVRPALARAENVVLSPHRAAFTHESTLRMRDMLIANLRAHFSGRPVLNPVQGFEHLMVKS
ncbi:MAG: 2-hydroxyacid dehydrogenase [Pseudomonadota bacterium]|nr:2-hydroxyacid dehydrogenase [Pseudomonadota bacterium]